MTTTSLSHLQDALVLPLLAEAVLAPSCDPAAPPGEVLASSGEAHGRNVGTVNKRGLSKNKRNPLELINNLLEN